MNPCRGEQTRQVRLGSLAVDVRQMVQKTTGEMMKTDVEEQGRDGGVAADMDHAQEVWQVAFSGAHEEQPLETQTESCDDGVYWLTDDDEHDLIVTDLYLFHGGSFHPIPASPSVLCPAISNVWPVIPLLHTASLLHLSLSFAHWFCLATSLGFLPPASYCRDKSV